MITLLAVCNSTHRESYFDIVMVSIVGGLLALAVVIGSGDRGRLVLEYGKLASNLVSAPALAESDTSSFDIDKAFALSTHRGPHLVWQKSPRRFHD